MKQRKTHRISRMIYEILGIFMLATVAVGEPTVIVGNVVGVSDGDTLTVLVDKQEIKIRLDGIDAPESGQPFGTQAKKALSEAVFAQPVRVTIIDVDRWKRQIGVVEVVDRKGRPHNVNLAMVRAGFAWHYTTYSDDEALAEAETQAREDRRGLWADPEPMPPWEWRKKDREKNKATTAILR